MPENSTKLNIAAKDYLATQMATIHNELDSLKTVIENRQSETDSLHSLRTSARRFFEVSEAVDRFLQSSSYERDRKLCRKILSLTGKLRNIDVMIINVGKMIQEHKDDDEVTLNCQLANFANWLEACRLRELKQAKSKLNTSKYDKNIRTIENRLMPGKNRNRNSDSKNGYLLSEAAAAMYYVTVAKIMRSQRRKNSLHELRIFCKGFRYLLEFLATDNCMKTTKYQINFKEFQDALGNWHDDYVMCRKMKTFNRRGDYRALESFVSERERLSCIIAKSAAAQLSQNWFSSAYTKMIENSSEP